MAVNKEILIQTADKGESLHLENFNIYEKFEQELMMQNPPVTDIFDANRIKVKTDGSKYIFNINGENKFTIGNADIERRMRQFCEKNEKRKEQEDVLVRIKGLKIEYIKTTTQTELNALKDDIDKLKTSEAKETDIKNVEYKVGRLITFFEQERELAKDEKSGGIFNTKYDRKDKGLRNIQKTEINRRLKELKKIKEQIERLKNNQGKNYDIEWDGEEIKDVKMGDANDFDMEITLKQLGERVQQLGKEAPDFIMTRNNIILEKGDTTPYYEYIVNNVKDATKLKLALNKINNDYVTLNKMSLTVAKRQALQQDLLALSEYLNKYINNPNTFDPAKEPFIPQSGEAFAEFCKIDPELKNFAKLNKKAGKGSKGEVNPAYPGTGTNEGNTDNQKTGNGTDKTKNSTEYSPSSYSNRNEALGEGGIEGESKYWLDQTHMSSEQKKFWSGVGNIAVTGGLVFVGWKMLSSAFKIVFKSNKEKKTGIYDSSNVARLGIPLVLTFGANARKGEGLSKILTGGAITKTIAGWFGGGNGSKEGTNDKTEKSETGIKYAEGFPGATALFNGLTYGEMKQFLVKDGDKMKVDPNQQQTLLDMFKTGSKKNEAGAKFLESIGKDDDKNIIDLALTGMGITREQIQSDGNKDKKFDKTASEAIARLRSVSDYMDQKGYNKINPETLPLVEKYIAEGKDIDDLEVLDKRGDVFYKETEVVDQTGLSAKIKELANGDKQKEEELLLALNTFWGNMPNAARNIEITGTRPTIGFKTYEQSSTINLNNKELVGFTPSRFSSYYETFKAANLTNYIKKLCKDKEATTKEPFHISTPGGDIEFADPSMFKFDTEIASAGMGGSLAEISPTLESNKQAYCDYLNTLNFRKTNITNATENIQFNENTKTLSIGDKKFKVSTKENVGGQRVDKNINGKVFTDMDETKKQSIQGLAAGNIGDKGTVTITKNGKTYQIDIERTT